MATTAAPLLTSGEACSDSVTTSEPATRRTLAYWPTIVDSRSAGMARSVSSASTSIWPDVVARQLLPGGDVANHLEHGLAVIEARVHEDVSTDRDGDQRHTTSNASVPAMPGGSRAAVRRWRVPA